MGLLPTPLPGYSERQSQANSVFTYVLVGQHKTVIQPVLEAWGSLSSLSFSAAQQHVA